MKLKNVAVCLSAFAIFAISFNAFADKKAEKTKLSNSEKAKEILAKSAKAMEEDHVKTKSKGKYETVTYFKKKKDGVSCMKFEHYKMQEGEKALVRSEIWIGNQGWTIIKDYVLKRPITTYSEEKMDSSKFKKPEFKVSKGNVDGEKCYIVSEIINIDDPLLPKIRQKIIREKDFVKVGSKDYDKNGKLFRSSKYTVTFKPLNDNIFEIPTDKTIKTFKNLDEYSDFLHELTKRKRINSEEGKK